MLASYVMTVNHGMAVQGKAGTKGNLGCADQSWPLSLAFGRCGIGYSAWLSDLLRRNHAIDQLEGDIVLHRPRVNSRRPSAYWKLKSMCCVKIQNVLSINKEYLATL